MRRILLSSAMCVSLAPTAACNWTDSARFADFRTEDGLEMTQAEPPAGAKPISTVYVCRSGWYLFALLPIVRAELPDAMDLLVKEARRLGADGVAKIAVDVRLSSFFTAWSQYVALSGECYKKR